MSKLIHLPPLYLFATICFFFNIAYASWQLAHVGPSPCSSSSLYRYNYDPTKYWHCINEINYLKNCSSSSTNEDEKRICSKEKGIKNAGIIAFHATILDGAYLMVTIEIGMHEEGGAITTISLPTDFTYQFGYTDCEMKESGKERNVTCYTDTYFALSHRSSFPAFGQSIFLLSSFVRETPLNIYLSSTYPSYPNTTMQHASFSCPKHSRTVKARDNRFCGSNAIKNITESKAYVEF